MIWYGAALLGSDMSMRKISPMGALAAGERAVTSRVCSRLEAVAQRPHAERRHAARAVVRAVLLTSRNVWMHARLLWLDAPERVGIS